MGTWDYRIVKRIWYNKLHEDHQEMFDLREVYYDENGDIDYMTYALSLIHISEPTRPY